MIKTVTQTLSGWGGMPKQQCHLFRPEKSHALEQLITSEDESTFLARGLGRAYGDAALNENGGVILNERLNRFISFDEESGVLECEGGVSLEEIIETFLPRGWFLPVSPGTKFVTIGGAVACDIHGKNHHRDGSFSAFVDQFHLLIASGETLICSRQQNAKAFWATIGGMGLTGIITRVQLRMRKVNTSSLVVNYQQLLNLGAVLEQLLEDEKHTYSVAWIDCLASGDSLGRGVLMRGEHAELDDLKVLSPRQMDNPLQLASSSALTVPIDMPEFLLNPTTVGAFNSLYYAAHKTKRVLVNYEKYFYPLDSISHWNRLYGKAGFIQYQVALPAQQSAAGLRALLEAISASKRASFLAVLKTFGAANEAPLSFPFKGHTLTFDIPFRDDLPEFVRQLDEITLQFGGRIYLAKDALVSAQNFRVMYPRWEEWLQIKRELDPQNRFSSSLARRLQMELYN
jgi:FAD/FMN-containing dehydrogenase